MEWLLPSGLSSPPAAATGLFVDRDLHLEQAGRRELLVRTVSLVEEAASYTGEARVCDLGCGDGALLSLLKGNPYVREAWGYSASPDHRQEWEDLGVNAAPLDVFDTDRDKVDFGDITVMNGVLENVPDPHWVLRWAALRTHYVVMSSPALENDLFHDPGHSWAWDFEGYRSLAEGSGFEVLVHELTVNERTQVLLGRNRWGRGD